MNQGQEITINHVKYYIPLMWKQMTYRQGIAAIKNTGNREMQLCEITGIPIDVLCKCENKQVAILFNLISFVDMLYDFNRDDVLPQFEKFDFGAIEYGEAEACKQIMTGELTGFEAVAKMIERLTGFDINDKPFLEVIGTANFFLTKSIVSMIVTPNLERVNIALSRSTQVLTDYKSLEALRRMLNSQEVEQSETQ